MVSVGLGDLNLETWSVAEDYLVDDSLVIVVISEGDFIENWSQLLLVIEDLETWLVAEDNFVDDSLIIVVISES